MSSYRNDTADACQSAGVWMAAIGTLAGMATIIGFHNEWPAHETIGSLIVAAVCGTLAWLAFRAEARWRRLK